MAYNFKDAALLQSPHLHLSLPKVLRPQRLLPSCSHKKTGTHRSGFILIARASTTPMRNISRRAGRTLRPFETSGRTAGLGLISAELEDEFDQHDRGTTVVEFERCSYRGSIKGGGINQHEFSLHRLRNRKSPDAMTGGGDWHHTGSMDSTSNDAIPFPVRANQLSI